MRATAAFPPVPCFPAGEVRATLADAHPALAASALAGWTGEATLSTITDGIRLAFEGGTPSNVERRAAARPNEARIRLMPGRFEALLFGYRSLAAIFAEDADCAADEEAEAVLAALFPPGDSFLRPI